MGTHSSVLAWRILGTAEPGGLPSLGSHRVGHDWSDLAAAGLFESLGRGSGSVFTWSRGGLVSKSCPTLCNPMDYSPPGSSVHGIFQARILESVVISFSRGSSPPRDWTWVSCIAGEKFVKIKYFNNVWLRQLSLSMPTSSSVSLSFIWGSIGVTMSAFGNLI